MDDRGPVKSSPAGRGLQTAPAPVRLVLDARRASIGTLSPTRKLLGLGLVERTVKAAWKAGISSLVIVADAGDREALLATLLPFGTLLSHLPAPRPDEATVLLPGDVLGEVGWLRALAEAGLPAGYHAIDALPERPVRLRSEGDVPSAERRLLQSLRKDTDGFMARLIARPISLAVSRRLAPYPVTPNQMTLVSVAIGLLAAPFFLLQDTSLQVIGGLLFVLHSILDGCDGELARLKFRESRSGGLLDFAGDNVVHVAVFGCMAIGWTLAWDSMLPAALGTAAVLGVIGSAFAVYWFTLRSGTGNGPVYTTVSTGPGTRLSRLLDELSRRDFIYLVLVLSVFGEAEWFLVATGIGAPVFLLLVLTVAARDRRLVNR